LYTSSALYFPPDLLSNLKMNSQTKNTPSSRTYAGQTEAERSAERRDRFLKAGLVLFGSVGLKGTTVRGLCETAGLTARYFYQSFENIDVLFCAVYDWQRDELQKTIIDQFSNSPNNLEVRTQGLIETYFTIMSNECTVRVLLMESMAGSQAIKDRDRENVKKLEKIATDMIRSDYPDLELSDDMGLVVSIAINGACSTLAVQWMLGGYSISKAVVVEGAIIVVRGIMLELQSR